MIGVRRRPPCRPCVAGLARAAGRVFVPMLMLVTAACGGAPAADPAAEAPGPGRGQAAVALAPHASLAALLPQPDDWTRAEVQSGTVGLPAPAAHASTTYTRDEARIDMDITDTAGQPDYVEATATIAGTTFNRESANGYIRGATVGGAPAVESWNHVDRLAEITVLVEGRIVVHASASGLDGIDALRAFIEQVDFARLAALAPSRAR